MPKRKIDPNTGEPELTHREQRLVDEYITNGGNGTRAATAAGYGAARADQSAYQVLHRPEVQHRIRQRIAESRVSADEIIGTLASFMRATPADFLDESGEFSIEVAKQRGVDHTLRSITVTTHEIKATKDKPAQVKRTYCGTLHSPIQAARALAHILGIDRKGTSPVRPPAPDPRPLTTDLQRDFDPLVWLEDLIGDQMRQTGLSRATVVDNLLQVRPEIAKYVNQLEQAQTPRPFDDLSLRETKLGLDLILDLLSLAKGGTPEPEHVNATQEQLYNPPAPAPDKDLIPQVQDCGANPQLQSSTNTPTEAEPSDNGLAASVSAPAAIARETPSDYSPFDQTYRFAFSTMSALEGDALTRLRFRDLVHEWMNTRALTEAQAIDAIRDRAKSEPFWFGCTIDACIAEYQRMRTAGLIQEPTATQQHDLRPAQRPPLAPPSQLLENSAFISLSGSLAEHSALNNVSTPEPAAPDSRLTTLDSRLPENSTFTNVSTPETPVPDSRLTTLDSRLPENSTFTNVSAHESDAPNSRLIAPASQESLLLSMFCSRASSCDPSPATDGVSPPSSDSISPQAVRELGHDEHKTRGRPRASVREDCTPQAPATD